MQAPKLLIRKGMVPIQGRTRPVIQVLAVVGPEMEKMLQEHFREVNLFKRTAYANGFPASVPEASPSLQPHLSNLMRNDACPEVAVKNLLGGQTFQAQTIWEMKAFEYIAQRAFDSLLDIMMTIAELGRETVYQPRQSELLAFVADAAADAPAVPVAIEPGTESVADAA
ncbi:MAG: hypothetical protein NW216_14860 [Hyphomicrobium sp.]|nr:hypothetical protein [Hyphomicrobium sp.]